MANVDAAGAHSSLLQEQEAAHDLQNGQSRNIAATQENLMKTQTAPTSLESISRPIALLIVTSLVSPVLLAGCGSNQQASAPPPPRDASAGEMGRMNPAAAPTRQGMSTRKKLVLLAGAAALYYMYKKKRDAANQPTNVQYYLSKNGRVYYRDSRTKQAIWVTPPRQGFQVPADEAMQYEGLQGYNGMNSGRDLSGLVPMAPSNF